MTVKELVELLKRANPDKKVFISVDEEGNDFKPICEVVTASGESDQAGNVLNGYIIYPNG